MFNGYVQVYTGNGKGKTTAALGLALRASGRGYRTFFGQFMKGQQYGELEAVKRVPEITLEQFGDVGWVFKGRIKPEQVDLAARGLGRAREVVASAAYQIVVLDELNMAVDFGLIPVEGVLELLDLRPPSVELVLTGRNAHPAVVERADLVTEMREVKHYYQRDVPAREGIEM